MSRTIDFRTGIREALNEELAHDGRVVLFGEDIAAAGGAFQITRGLLGKYGSGRVFDTPISELALAGCAFGSAVTGLRPVIEIMFGDFMALAMDSLVNQSAKYWFLSNEQSSVPLVVRTTVGAGGRFGAIHSQSPAPWVQAVPGLKIVAPATPAAAKQLLKASIRDDNPVIFLEHKRLYGVKGEIAEEDEVEPLGRATILREGSDLTLVGAMKTVSDALLAEEQLRSARGISADVIDLQTLRPLDMVTLCDSVKKTHRLVAVEEGPHSGGWAAEVIAGVKESIGAELKDAWRVTMPDLPIPYSPSLEDACLVDVAAIVKSIEERM